MKPDLYALLCCPNCQKELSHIKDGLKCSSCKKNYPIVNRVPDFSLAIEEKELRLSKQKWDKKYKEDSKKDITEELNFLDKKFFNMTWKQIEKTRKLRNNEIFMEVGCGTFYLGKHLANEGKTVVGIDMSMEALQLARKVFDKEKLKNYLLVCGNILNMPFKGDSFNLIYGGGVIEHFKDTKEALVELSRVLKKGGVSYNTVPYLNLGTLTYRQLWGNIPRFPVIEEIFTFIHTNLLKAKHMRFGYELSFTRKYLEDIHKKNGFQKATTGKFECTLDFEYIPFKPLRNIAIKLATNSSLFWPMIYVAGKK